MQVTSHVGDAELEGALKGADLVVIPAGKQQPSAAAELGQQLTIAYRRLVCKGYNSNSAR